MVCLAKTTLLLRHTREPLQLYRVDDAELEAWLHSVIEEYEVDDYAESGELSESNVLDAEDDYDVRDLLVDEVD